MTDYPGGKSGSGRAFLKVRFAGVSGFRREPGLSPKWSKAIGLYQSRKGRGGIVVQAARFSKKKEKRHADIWFGPAFGGISFTYTKSAGLIRDAIAKRSGKGFIYRDAETGRRIKFFHPFAPPEPRKPSRAWTDP